MTEPPTDIVSSVRACHKPSPTAPDFCVFCDDDKWPCDSLLLCEALEEVHQQAAVAFARVRAAMGDLDCSYGYSMGEPGCHCLMCRVRAALDEVTSGAPEETVQMDARNLRRERDAAHLEVAARTAERDAALEDAVALTRCVELTEAERDERQNFLIEIQQRCLQAEGALARVRELHLHERDDRHEWCVADGRPWPCPTIAALPPAESGVWINLAEPEKWTPAEIAAVLVALGGTADA